MNVKKKSGSGTLPELAAEVEQALLRVKKAEAKLEAARRAHLALVHTYAERAAEKSNF